MANILEMEDNLLTEMKKNDYLHDNTIYFDTEVDRESQVKVCRMMRKIAEKELSKPVEKRKAIKLRISSFGGSILAFFAIASCMQEIKEKGIIIETYCDGYCCSAASKILILGSPQHRFSSRYGEILIHQTQLGGLQGTQTELENEMKNIKRNWETIKTIFKENTKLTDEDIENLTKYNLDVVYTPQEALEKVTEEKIENSLNYDILTKEEQKAIDEFNSKIDVTDTTQVIQYGAAAQEKISQFSDSILEDVKTKNLGETGDLLADLVSQIKAFDKDVSGGNKGFFAKLFNNAKKEVDFAIAKYSKIEKNIDTIENGLEKDKLQMLKDISIFDTMYEKNLEYFKEISLYIIAGERKLEELRNKVLPELQETDKKSGEQLDVQKVNDMENMINRFEKKIYDLKTTRIISIQMAPQIRLLQNNEAELVEKIQSSITNTIPLWKNQMVLALGINNAKNALKSQQAVSKLTNEMLVKNSETLKQGSIDIAEESEKAIVNIETIKKTNADLIETLDKVIEIHKNGRIKRQEAEKELETIEKELKDKMLEIHVEK